MISKPLRSPVFWCGTVVFALTLLPFLQTLTHDFINLDDYMYVTETLPVRVGLSWVSVRWAFCSFSHESIWMPLTWISYMADVSLWGIHPGAMHLHNAVLHACNAVLLFLLLIQILLISRQGTKAQGSENANSCVFSVLRPPSSVLWISAFAALFWSLHPLRVEPVAWIASRKDVLSLFWELLALIFWVKQTQTSKDSPSSFILHPSTFFWFLSLFCFVCAGMSKPTAMTFPVLALLLEYQVAEKVRWQKLFWPFMLALGLAALATYSQSAGGARIALAGVPLIGRLLNAVAAVGFYCWKTLLPTALSLPYLHTWPALPKFFWPGLAICTMYGMALLWSGRKVLSSVVHYCRHLLNARATPAAAPSSVLCPPPSTLHVQLFVGLAFFLVAVSPMLGLAHFGYHSHADRFTYLPAVGFSIVLAVGTSWISLRATRSQHVVFLGLICTVVLCGLGALSWRQTAYWRNDLTLFTHTIKADRTLNHIACRNLGIYYYGTKHDCLGAVKWLGEAFRRDREGSRNAQMTYILALSEAGLLERAKDEARELCAWVEQTGLSAMEQARRMGINTVEDGEVKSTSVRTVDTFLSYAVIAFYEGDKPLARQHVEYVLKNKPRNGCGHYIMGLLELGEGRQKEALEHWRMALQYGNITQFAFLKARIKELEAQMLERGDGLGERRVIIGGKTG